MGASFATLLGRARTIADVDVTDVSDSEINQALVDAYLEALADEPWPFLQARFTFETSVGVAEYSVSSFAQANLEPGHIRRVQMGGVDLVRIEAEDYYIVNPQGGTPSTGGLVRWWTTLESDVLALWPPPASVATCRIIYTRTPTALGGTAVTEWPQRYDDSLVAGALVYIYQKQGDFDSAEIKKKEFSDRVRAIRSDAMKPNVYSPIFIGGAPEQDDRPRPPILVP